MFRVGSVGGVLLAGVLLILGLRCFGIDPIPAWFLGVLAGASSANLIAGRRALAGRITSLLIFCFAAWTMTSIPHPAWFVASACGAILFAAFVADRAFGRVRL